MLWYAYNAEDQIPEPDAATQAIFDQGREVGALAKALYPGGIEVSAGATDFDQVLQQSLEAAKARRPLFEAGFVHNGGFARADILNRLRDCISDNGTVVVYYEKFEKGVLDGLAEAFPEHTGWIENVKRRIVDLLEPLQAFDYYHPQQHGSASIKSVLPVLTGAATPIWRFRKAGRRALNTCGFTSAACRRPSAARCGSSLSGTAGRTRRAWSGLLMRCGSSRLERGVERPVAPAALPDYAALFATALNHV